MTDIDIPLVPLAIAAVIVLSAVALPIVPTGGPSGDTSGTVHTPDPVTPDIEPDTSADANPPTPAGAELYALPDEHTRTATDGIDAPPVRASAGAQTMDARVTTAGGELALKLQDDRTHDGRWVSVPTTWLRDELGAVPGYVTIAHSSGESYTTETYARSDGLAFYVKEFSTNTVTFAGSTNLSATPATNSTTLTYELNNATSSTDPRIALTGYQTTESESIDATRTRDGETLYAFAGTEAVDDVSVELTGGRARDHTPTTINTTTVDIVEAVVEESPGQTECTIELNRNGNTIATKSPFVGADEQEIVRFTDLGNTSTDGDSYSATTPDCDSASVRFTESNPPSNNAIDYVDGSTSVQDLSVGQTITVSLPDVDPGDPVTFRTDTGQVNATIAGTEATTTTDPRVSVNGNTVAEPGPLADGETVTKSLSASVLRDGTNTVDVSVGDGSLTAAAPTPSVGIEYSHESEHNQTVDYVAGKWVERYNVSKTWADDRQDATLTIPFASNIIRIESVKTDTNSTGLTETANYTLSGTTLTVELGSVNASETVRVTAQGSKFAENRANVTVVEPTTSGSLNTRIRVDDWGSGADSYLAVDGTPDGAHLHYLTDAYSDESHYLVEQADGTHRLYLPNAAAGDKLTAQTVNYSLDAASGEVRYELTRTDESDLELDIDPGGSRGDPVDITYENAQDGETYVLESVTAGVVRDQGEANSPLTLSDDDSPETLRFFAETDSGGGSSDAGGGGAGPIGVPTGDPNFAPLAGIALALGLLVIVSRNNETVSEAGADTAAALDDTVPVVGPAAAAGVRTGSQLVAALFENRIVAVALGAAIVVGATQGGIIDLGGTAQVLVAIVGVGVGGVVGLREIDAFTPRRWVALVAAATVVTLQTLGTGDILTAVTESQAFPIVVVALAGGALWLIQGIRQGLSTPDQVTRIQVDGETVRESDD